MKKYRKLIAIFSVFALVTALFTGCGKKQSAEPSTDTAADTTTETTDITDVAATDAEAATDMTATSNDITIVYTNDVHSYIDNVVKDEEGNIVGDGLRFSKIAAMVNDMKKEGGNVLLLDAGDEIQGGIYGAMDEGQTIIELMNATGYDAATPGNHDFDYGVIEFLRVAENANFNYLSCNFHATMSREIVFPPYQIFEMGGKKVAIIGISTPETITSATPVYFQNENGEFIYTVDGCDNVSDFYNSVQTTVDSVRDKADYVIALGHVGIGASQKQKGISSEDLIANVSGLDAFIDGHSHSTIEGSYIKDKDSHDVLLTQTGNYLSAVGVMTISADGKISTRLVNDYEREEESVAKMEQDWFADVASTMNEQIAVLDNTLYINNPENANQRLIRSQEMNIGDLNADSVYWFFNERIGLNCDVAFQNSGGIRTQIESGPLTYMDAKEVNPFGNMICLISATGQEIIDALEMGCTQIGVWDDEWDAPAENGGFMQVAGLSYTVDSTIPSSVKTDGTGMFQSVDGDYRVKNVKVYNRATGEYDPIDPAKTYTLGGLNYVLRNGGNGLNMFEDNDLMIDYVGQDYVILAEYIKSFTAENGLPKINTANSPLSGYHGYLLDYENPFGSGRITIE